MKINEGMNPIAVNEVHQPKNCMSTFHQIQAESRFAQPTATGVKKYYKQYNINSFIIVAPILCSV